MSNGLRKRSFYVIAIICKIKYLEIKTKVIVNTYKLDKAMNKNIYLL